MKVVGVALVLLLSSCAVTAGYPPALKQAQSSYVQITDAAGNHTCGATKVAERTVMTAAHCLDGDSIRVGGQPVGVTDMTLDENDHALVVVPESLPGKAAKLSHRLPEVGQKLYVWGKPWGVGPLYREGSYIGPAVAPTGIKWLMASLMVAGGDSGSGVFDEKGRLVGTVSISVNGLPVPGLGWMGFQPYGFTAEQWKVVR